MARQVFGEAHIEQKRSERLNPAEPAQPAEEPQPPPAEPAEPMQVVEPIESESHERTEAKVFTALFKLGFAKHEIRRTLAELRRRPIEAGIEPLLRASLLALAPS